VPRKSPTRSRPRRAQSIERRRHRARLAALLHPFKYSAISAPRALWSPLPQRRVHRTEHTAQTADLCHHPATDGERRIDLRDRRVQGLPSPGLFVIAFGL
jgi:hypothetical protein